MQRFLLAQQEARKLDHELKQLKAAKANSDSDMQPDVLAERVVNVDGTTISPRGANSVANASAVIATNCRGVRQHAAHAELYKNVFDWWDTKC